jgi:hypothetical protein
VDDLKEKIKKNDTIFVKNMQYFSASVLGLDTYWGNKRSELLSWINHHIEDNNGAPSCVVCHQGRLTGVDTSARAILRR